MLATEFPAIAPRRAAVLAVGLVFLDSLLGQLATLPNLAWYDELNKPFFAIPAAALSPIWTALYALMALAFWRILIQPQQKARTLAIGLFLAQLAFNVVWFFAFFAAQSPLLGLIDIVLQAALMLAAMILFWRLDRIAGLCLAPLALWVGYIAAVNFAVWRLSG